MNAEHRTSGRIANPSCRFCAIILALLLVGCSSADTEPTESDKISAVVADISDASFDKQKLADLFTAGNAPAQKQRKRYPIYMYRTRAVDIQGELATATVEIEHGTTGEIAGEFPWKLRREGESWKLVEAPLPEG